MGCLFEKKSQAKLKLTLIQLDVVVSSRRHNVVIYQVLLKYNQSRMIHTNLFI